MEDPDPARSAAERLAELTGVPRHRAVVVLGSGWAPAADALGEPVATLPMTDLPGFVAPVAEGHRGTVASYDVGGVPTLALFGRTHLYEGLGLGPVVHGIRTAAAAGCTTRGAHQRQRRRSATTGRSVASSWCATTST